MKAFCAQANMAKVKKFTTFIHWSRNEIIKINSAPGGDSCWLLHKSLSSKLVPFCGPLDTHIHPHPQRCSATHNALIYLVDRHKFAQLNIKLANWRAKSHNLFFCHAAQILLLAMPIAATATAQDFLDFYFCKLCKTLYWGCGGAARLRSKQND